MAGNSPGPRGQYDFNKLRSTLRKNYFQGDISKETFNIDRKQVTDSEKKDATKKLGRKKLSELNFDWDSEGLDKILPLATNIANSLKKPPVPVLGPMARATNYSSVNMDGSKEEVRQAVRTSNMEATGSLSANAAGAVKAGNMGAQLRALSAVGEKETMINLGQADKKAESVAIADFQNKATYAKYGEDQANREMAIQGSRSANLADAVDKTVQMGNDKRMEEMEMKKYKILMDTFSTGGVDKRVHDILVASGLIKADANKRYGGKMALGGSLTEGDSGGEDPNPKPKGGLKLYTQSNTSEGGVTPTGQPNKFSNNSTGLTEDRLYEIAKKHGFRTGSNVEFQEDLEKFMTTTNPDKWKQIQDKYGPTAAGKFADGHLGARTNYALELLNDVPPPPPKQEYQNPDKGYVVNVRGDEKDGQGVYYFPQDENALNLVKQRVPKFSTSQVKQGQGQVSYDMHENVFNEYHLKNDPEALGALGEAYIRDPSDPTRYIPRKKATVSAEDVAKKMMYGGKMKKVSRLLMK